MVLKVEHKSPKQGFNRRVLQGGRCETNTLSQKYSFASGQLREREKEMVGQIRRGISSLLGFIVLKGGMIGRLVSYVVFLMCLFLIIITICPL